MIFQLKGADFSANNIGKVDLPIVWDDDARAFVNTLAGHEDFSDSKNRSINNLFSSLKVNNIWSKVVTLIFPIFGQADAGKNVKGSGNITMPVNSSFDQYGLNLNTNAWTWNRTFNRTNQCIGVYNTQPTTTPNGNFCVSMGFQSGANIGAGRKVLASNAQAGVVISSPVRIQINNRANNSGLILLSSNQSIPLLHCMVDGEGNSDSDAWGNGNTPILLIGGTNATTTASFLNAPIGCVFDSSYLTLDEMAIVDNLIDNVVKSFMP